MKLIKIFSSVLALHVVALTVFFLSPGCQSKPKSDSAAASSPPAAAVQPVEENWSSQGSTGYDSVQPVVREYTAPAPLTGPTPAERVRQSPTRPADDRGFYDRPAKNVTTPAPESINAPVLAEYTVVPGDSLWRIANGHGISVAELQKMNPGVRANSLQPGAILNVPASWSGSGAAATGGSVTSSAVTSTYVVRGGDSLSKIAARNGTTVGALRRANSLTSDNLQVGQIINIPEGSTPPPDDSAPPRGNSITVKVQRGDTLGAIARKFDVTVAELMDANNISDPRRVRAGQTLIVPGFQAVGSGQVPIVAPPPSRPEPRMIPAPVVETTRPPISVEPVEPADDDLDALLPDDAVDAPVVPIDDPVPQP